MIQEIGGKVVMVSNQAEALDFYTGKLGFNKWVDMQIGDTRWVEVAPADSQVTIALVEPGPDFLPHEAVEDARRAIGTPQGLWFFTDDIQATYEELLAKGVEITEPERLERRELLISTVRDQDGNEFQILCVSPEEQA